MKILFKVVFILNFMLSGTTLFSQILVPLESNFSRTLDEWAISNDINLPTFTKPVSIEFLGKLVNTDSLFSFKINKPEEKKNWFIRKLRYENLAKVDTSDFSIALDPLFNLQYEKDPKLHENWYTNTRGIRIFGSVGKELYFESSFYENQSKFPTYLNDYVNSSMDVPGQGSIKRLGEFDYANATGLLFCQAGKHVEFSFGHGKLFIGDGYRSLFLSDNSFNFPFFRVTLNFKKFQYSRIMAVLMSDSIPEDDFGVREKKLAGFNILTYMPNYWFQISLFEGTIWNYPNSKKNIDFDGNYLNPVILINSFLRNVSCKSVLGTGIKLNILKTIQVYNQLAVDKISNKLNSTEHLSLQAGAKYFDAFTLKNLYLQAEYNTSQKGVYDYNSKILIYSHYNQPLAHPLGTNFNEWIIKTHYNYKSWQFDVQFNFAKYGSDTLNKITGSPYFKDYIFQTPFIGNGPKTVLSYKNFCLAYLINPKTNMRIEAGYISRNATISGNKYNTNFFYISIITSLTNWYYDF
jgi:hypothetical protein